MSLLTPADDLCCVWFIYPVFCWFWCPEIGTSSIDWAQLSRPLPEDRDSPSSKTFLNKNRMMDNVQKGNHCRNVHTQGCYYFTSLQKSRL
jgi:hypothetical protein